jgi:hypothetical protein
MANGACISHMEETGASKKHPLMIDRPRGSSHPPPSPTCSDRWRRPFVRISPKERAHWVARPARGRDIVATMPKRELAARGNGEIYRRRM